MTTMQQVTPSQLFTILVAAIKARLNALVIGGPGVGKSQIIVQAAAAADADHMISNPPVEDPTVPGGLPWFDKGADHATFKPFGNLYRAMKATKLLAWILEELGQAPAAMQAAYMHLLLAKEVNGNKLPDVVTFIATSNRRTDRAGVSGILEPVKSRFAFIVELVPTLADWATWFVPQPFYNPEILAFLRFREGDNLLNKFEPSADLVNSPTPRTWAQAAQALLLGLPKAEEAAVLAGAIGEGTAGEFLAFRTMFRELPSIQDCITHPTTAPVPENLSARYAVVTGLAALATPDNWSKVDKYLARLHEAGAGDFAALTVKDAARRLPELQTEPAFIRTMAGPLGQLVAPKA